MKLLQSRHGSTLFLRLAVSVIGLGVLALCLFLLPLAWIHAYEEYPYDGYAVRAVVAGMYITTLPFYLGIYKGWRLLNLVDKGNVFSVDSVKTLRFIAYCAGIISGVYIIILPFFYIWAEVDDAPGLIVISLFLVGMPMIVSVAVGLLKQLLAEAVKIKSENELTV